MVKTLREKIWWIKYNEKCHKKSVLDETTSTLERSFKAELPTDVGMENIPLMELSCLVENSHVKTREASQNTKLNMREFLGIDKALQNIQGGLLNNTSKLADINKRIKRDTQKLEEVENDPTYSDKQRQLYKDRLDDLNTEKQERSEILQKIEKTFKSRSQESNKLMKRFLIKIRL